MGAKKTSELIPLCHPLPLSSIKLDLEVDDHGVIVTATAKTSGQTGVEMEALVAVSTALLTIYDMAKAVDKSMIIRSEEHTSVLQSLMRISYAVFCFKQTRHTNINKH